MNLAAGPTAPVWVAIVVAGIGMLGGVTAAILTFFSQRRSTKEASRVADTNTAINGLSGLVDQLQEEVKGARAFATETEARLEATKTELREAKEEIRALRRQLDDRDTEVDNLRAEVAGLAGQIEALKMQKGLS